MMTSSTVRPFALFRWFGVRRLSEPAILVQKLQELVKAAELQIKGARKNVHDGAVFFRQRVKTFFTRLFATEESHGRRRE